MALEKVNELVKAVESNPESWEVLQGLIISADKDGIISFLAETANRLGIDVTEEDILETIAEKERNQKNKTEEAIADVEKIPDDELGDVAGGSRSYCNSSHIDQCSDTFADHENCWSNDGCDKNHNMYEDYLCDHNDKGHQCGSKASMQCRQIFTPFCEWGNL